MQLGAIRRKLGASDPLRWSRRSVCGAPLLAALRLSRRFVFSRRSVFAALRFSFAVLNFLVCGAPFFVSGASYAALICFVFAALRAFFRGAPF